jgi:protein-L-isoaspartate(D-aspartate) O-methyltransferase
MDATPLVLPLVSLACSLIPWPLQRAAGSSPQQSADRWAGAREQMVARQIADRGIADARVLAALRAVPRHLFVMPGSEDEAYEDRPVGIGYGQTISQPYIVALMTELARVKPGDRVLEIGTGSGYQAAVLSRLAGAVHTIEIVEPLADRARQLLADLACRNVTVRTGDGYAGWPEAAPFNAILVTAAPDHVPPALVAQLARGGRLVIPVGGIRDVQQLQLIEKDEGGAVHARDVIEVRFVPLVRKKEGSEEP